MARTRGSKNKSPRTPKAGQVVTLKNGAKAQVQADGRWKITKGANKAGMQAVRAARRSASERHKERITDRQARMAFNKHYSSDKRSPRGHAIAR